MTSTAEVEAYRLRRRQRMRAKPIGIHPGPETAFHGGHSAADRERLPKRPD